jgi:hypothetical protein
MAFLVRFRPSDLAGRRSPHCELPGSANGANLPRVVLEEHVMRKLTLAIAAAAGLTAAPVLACSMHQTAAQSTGSTAGASPMMCSTQTATTQAQQPGQVTQPAQPGQSTGGMCPCCRNMAMMQPQPGQPGGMQNMPGMPSMPDMQQGAPASPLAPTPSPETPKPN